MKKVYRFLNALLFVFNCCLVLAFLFGAYSCYTIVNPAMPKITSPQVLLEETKQLLPTVKLELADHEPIEIPREQWPPSVRELKPRYVLVETGSQASVDIVVFTGGALGGNRGYLIRFGASPDESDDNRHKLLFADETAVITRYSYDY